MTIDAINAYCYNFLQTRVRLGLINGKEVAFTGFQKDGSDIVAKLVFERRPQEVRTELIRVSGPDRDAWEILPEVDGEYLKAYSRMAVAAKVTATDFPNGFNLKRLYDLIGGEAEAWDAYFVNGFDDEMRTQFENAQQPGARVTAVIMRAAMKVMKEAK